MSIFEVGRMCMKLAGRDAGKRCVVVKKIDDTFVMIDGATRRRKVNIKHLEPLAQMIEVADGSHEKVVAAFKDLGVELKATKARKAAARPRKQKKAKVKVAKPKKAAKAKDAKKETVEVKEMPKVEPKKETKAQEKPVEAAPKVEEKKQEPVQEIPKAE
jgi:large subunit ribosomal protein L14e